MAKHQTYIIAMNSEGKKRASERGKRILKGKKLVIYAKKLPI